jgi:hypothetical protein
VPWILCHDEGLCSEVNADGGGALGNAVCTINGFWEDGSNEGDSQPSPAFVGSQRKNNPNQPLSWTEVRFLRAPPPRRFCCTCLRP